MTDTIRYDRGADGIVTLTLDDPTQSANTMNRAYAASMSAVLDRLEAEPDLAGVMVTSAKSTFFAGGDLPEMIRATRADAPALAELLGTIKRDLRRLETLGRPVVAAVNGSALGGGLEITLACHHRIALDVPDSRLGLPEVTLGLLPGAGGVTRTVRMLGLAEALTTVLLTGRRMRPADALAAGLVDEVVGTEAELRDRAVPGSSPTRSRSSRGTGRTTGCPAAARPAVPSPRSCPPSRPPCASSSRAPGCPRPRRSWPPPSKARRSTWTPRSQWRPGT
ncbi:enoyl-CoA hydratase-related protein [Micromonospora tarensis]|uniref:enoyl-CoA hydratase-related protein n=1 Tax=Micromonospora tarensis TaxID=2806100 RepID=UPI00272EB681|nr:enoyl-CoA hydratase-related protein [Micromonospora tarensis]